MNEIVLIAICSIIIGIFVFCNLERKRHEQERKEAMERWFDSWKDDMKQLDLQYASRRLIYQKLAASST